ncbi:cytochrome c-type biogenesis protein [Pseudoprimorskyibacter insulae]|uniref:Cytochrome c-type biogenesis protein n=1 Tax=Pseudoprimorskyibacter insulae TaxID=1695997 RepID=A0A2R8AXK0_9RHOB|nr:cytochrome c-type biogenesis protein [Pseudoprimorskyibacter insulae]SPF80740.1 Cytochrome c-type biogenesis protein CcmH [Pseudoprimorskyibacter insulae]
MTVISKRWVRNPPYVLALIFAMLANVAIAVQPDEVLQDPALEARAREISKGLRCLVCQNENIDDSNASLARDLRILVRDRLEEGDTDEQVVDFVVERYGEFVLLKPTTAGGNWLLWAAGPILFVIAALLAMVYIRRRASAPQPVDGLSAEEQTRLDEILKG